MLTDNEASLTEDRGMRWRGEPMKSSGCLEMRVALRDAGHGQGTQHCHPYPPPPNLSVL